VNLRKITSRIVNIVSLQNITYYKLTTHDKKKEEINDEEEEEEKCMKKIHGFMVDNSALDWSGLPAKINA
jgi:hypothetical protein